MGGATSIDVTREGVDKAYGLQKLCDASGISLDAMMFVGDAIFPGGNDYIAKLLGLDTVRVREPQETLSVIETIVACQKVAGSEKPQPAGNPEQTAAGRGSRQDRLGTGDPGRVGSTGR